MPLYHHTSFYGRQNLKARIFFSWKAPPSHMFSSHFGGKARGVVPGVSWKCLRLAHRSGLFISTRFCLKKSAQNPASKSRKGTLSEWITKGASFFPTRAIILGPFIFNAIVKCFDPWKFYRYVVYFPV